MSRWVWGWHYNGRCYDSDAEAAATSAGLGNIIGSAILTSMASTAAVSTINNRESGAVLSDTFSADSLKNAPSEGSPPEPFPMRMPIGFPSADKQERQPKAFSLQRNQHSVPPTILRTFSIGAQRLIRPPAR